MSNTPVRRSPDKFKLYEKHEVLELLRDSPRRLPFEPYGSCNQRSCNNGVIKVGLHEDLPEVYYLVCSNYVCGECDFTYRINL